MIEEEAIANPKAASLFLLQIILNNGNPLKDNKWTLAFFVIDKVVFDSKSSVEVFTKQ